MGLNGPAMADISGELVVVEGTAEDVDFKCQVPGCGGMIAFSKYGSSEEEI